VLKRGQLAEILCFESWKFGAEGLCVETWKIGTEFAC